MSTEGESRQGWRGSAGILLMIWVGLALVGGGVVTGVAGADYSFGSSALSYFAIMLVHFAAVLLVRWLVTRARPTLATLSDVLVILTLMTVLVEGYVAIKVQLPLVNTTVWDGEMAALDRLLGLGLDPNVFLVTIFAGAPDLFARALDYYYLSFVGLFALFAAWFLSAPERRDRLAFANGWALIWCLGAFVYLLFPVRGPVYFTTGLFEEISRVFPIAAGLQAALWSNYAALVSGNSTEIVHEYGVAAMPSLHVATHCYLWLWARRTGSPAAPLFLTMTLLTWLGSVATGWHYAVDGAAGVLLAGLGTWLALRLREGEGMPADATPEESQSSP